jgi:branched-chain amino acid transport system substrate-binding protein
MKKGYPRLLLFVLSLILIVSIVSLSACSGSSSTEGKVLKVGMILPYTGAAAEKGKPGGDAVKDAIEYVNKELNGANGYQIQISWRDSQYTADTVSTIVKDFMNEGCLLFTAMSSFEMTAAQTIANRAGFPGIVSFAAPSNLTEHIYAHAPDYGDDWVAFVNYYLKNIWRGSGKPKMALHLLNNTTGSSVKDIATARAAAMGVEIVATEEHKADTISEMETLTRIKSKNPDVIYIASTPKPTSVIMKNAKDLGMLTSSMTVGMGHAAVGKTLVDLAGADAVEGTYGVFTTVTWDDKVPGIAKATEYVKKNNPSDYGTAEYLANWNTSLVVAEILRNAVKNVGYDVLAKGDANAWKAVEQSGIQKLNGYNVEGIQGPVSYNGSNKLGTAVKIYITTSGKMVAKSDWIEAK